MKQKSWQTFGHEPVKSLLEGQLEQDGLAHAYLFAGPDGVGKETLAREFAAKILNTESLQNHPDFLAFDTSRDTGAGGIRQAIGQLSVKPFIARYKVAIFKNIDQLNHFGANALLKTLEEPTASTILILLSPTQHILPTIASRCLEINFNRFTNEQLKAFASGRKLKVSDAVISLSRGSIGWMTEAVADPESLKLTVSHLEALDALLGQPRSERILALAQFAELENVELEKILLAWALSQQQLLAVYPARYSLIRNILSAVGGLRSSGNKKMILQQLFLSMNFRA